MKWKHSKNNTKISGEIKTPKETMMKNSKVGQVNKCNQQWQHPKAILKIGGEMKTSEETVMKNPKRYSY